MSSTYGFDDEQPNFSVEAEEALRNGDDDDDGPQPFQLEDVPPAFDNPIAVEAEAQAELVEHQRGQRNHNDELNAIAFRKLGPPVQTTLTTLKKIYDNSLELVAMQNMSKRQQIVLDPPMVLNYQTDKILWYTDDHFLDFRLLLSKDLGFNAVVPNMRNNYAWAATLNFNKWIVQWKVKHADLGFSLTRRMLLIGRAAQEDIWIVFAPHEYVRHAVTEGDAGLDGTTTNLTPTNARRFYAFLCWQLTQLSISDFNSKKKYPDVTSQEAMNAGCNILTHQEFDLRLEDARKLGEKIEEDYDLYFAGAPPSWQHDTFFKDHVPLTATMRYGQNQPIVGDSDSNKQEAILWDRERDWSAISTAFIAIASDICAKERVGKRPISNDVIQQENDEIFDGPARPRCIYQALGELPLRDDNGERIRLYNRHGEEIPRMEYTHRGTPCGLLVNFENIDTLFPQETSYQMDGKLPVSTTVNRYPQAYLRDHGHIQADNVLATFLPVLEQINEAIQHPPGSEPQEDEVFRDIPPVTGISCQVYNELAHRYRPDVQHHDVQLGRQTAALAGTHAETPKDQAAAARHRAKCTPDLPYENFRQIISTPNQNVNLRVEQVFKVDLAAVKPRYCTGRSIFWKVVVPITQAWKDGEVGEAMKPHITVFRPHVMPKLYLWTTYGVTSYLKCLWETAQLAASTRPTSAYIIELMSCFERSLNFSQTGSHRTISIALMEALGFTLGMRTDGQPCIFPGLIQPTYTSPRRVTIMQNKWPLYPNSPNGPMVGSKRSQQLNYSEIHWETYKARMDLLHLSQHIPAGLYPATTPAKHRQALVGLYYGMGLLVRDMRNLVIHGVEAATKGDLASDDYVIVANAKDRLNSLKAWREYKAPFSSTTRTASSLIRTVASDHYQEGLPPSNPATITPKALATRLVAHCYPEIKLPLCAPFSKLGSAHTVLRLALIMMVNLLSRTLGPTLESVMVASVEQLLTDLSISHIPWHRPPTGNRGRSSRTPVYNIWMRIYLGPEERADHVDTLIGASSADAVNALIGARLINSQDSRGKYEICSLSWSDAKRLLTRRTLPDEYTRTEADSTRTGPGPDGETYIHRTYDHVSRVFKGLEDPLHHLALLSCLALIRSLPRVLCEHRAAPPGLSKESGPITSAVRSTPWFARPGKRGVSEGSPFVTMWIAFVVARFDPASPLNDERRRTGSLGRLWLDKNSTKGISAFNLVRMGFANANNKQIFTSPKDSAYSLKSSTEIQAFHGQIKRLLESSNPYAPFDALTVGLLVIFLFLGWA
ncbi:hypothetical protein BD779DRAFT_1679574 [Infundibulicybe gibba]|nr:hypothetical protein BD779DRAFT_1679574 [Infundibulicybe gibba]